MVKAIFNHRSIRKYKSDPIDEKLLKEILQAGIRASNTGNMQLYSIIVTKDENLKNQLWEAHFKQDMVKQAPVLLTFVADINRFHRWCELRNAGTAYDNFLWFYNATIDAVIAAQNVAIEAEDKGLGICYLGTTTYMARKIIEILNLPKGVVPVTSLVLGYPDETPELTDRLPFDAVVFDEKYSELTENQIDKMWKEKENSKLTKKLIEENQTENLAQIFTQKRYKKQDNVFFSKEFLKIIEEQGFMNNE
jgi:nitroreductase